MGVTAGIVEFADFDNAEQEGPHLVRSHKIPYRLGSPRSLFAGR